MTFAGNIACISVFSSKSVDLKPSFANILKCLSIYDICLLVKILIFRKYNTNKLNKKVREKNAKNALTSHYANGHGDPCDKWVKNHFDASTGHQVNFFKGLGFFHTSQHVRRGRTKSLVSSKLSDVSIFVQTNCQMLSENT